MNENIDAINLQEKGKNSKLETNNKNIDLYINPLNNLIKNVEKINISHEFDSVQQTSQVLN